jgi:hypothetical protein
MTILTKAAQVRNNVPVPSAGNATDIIAVVGDWTVPTGFAATNVVELGAIPAGYVPVDLIVDHAALGATVTADFGILTGNYGDGTQGVATTRTVGAQFAAAQAMGTAGIKRAAAVGSGRIAPTTNDRSFGFVATAVTTPTVGAVLRATLLCRPQSEGV